MSGKRAFLGATIKRCRAACAYVAESYGSDVILSNLLAFDVKAYDPDVAVQRAISGPIQSCLAIPAIAHCLSAIRT